MPSPRRPLVRELIWRLEAIGFDLVTLIVRAAPIDAVSSFGALLFRALGPLSSANRTAKINLRFAFPERSEAERSRLLREQWASFGRYIAEFPVLDQLTPKGGRVEVVGAERLASIAAAGRPVVFISGHFSNMEVMVTVILDAGIECEITYRATNNPFVDARIRHGRLRYGVRLLAAKGGYGARELLAAMRRGQSVAMMNDQRYDAGVAAPFFGRPAMTLPAGVRLAMRFGAVIQPMSIQRLAGARFRCFVHEPIIPPETGDRAADIVAGVGAINAFIEERVRERPSEWWWMHRRWPADLYARD